eukprot:7857982-Prorocentrum_lima.AAC.1
MEARIDLKTNVGTFTGMSEEAGQVLQESRAGHSLLPLVPREGWSLGAFKPKAGTAVLTLCDPAPIEAFRAERVKASRT